MRSQPEIELGLGGLPVGFDDGGFGIRHLWGKGLGDGGRWGLRFWILCRFLGEPGGRGEEEDEKGEAEHGLPHNQFNGAGYERNGMGRVRAFPRNTVCLLISIRVAACRGSRRLDEAGFGVRRSWIRYRVRRKRAAEEIDGTPLFVNGRPES